MSLDAEFQAAVDSIRLVWDFFFFLQYCVWSQCGPTIRPLVCTENNSVLEPESVKIGGSSLQFSNPE